MRVLAERLGIPVVEHRVQGFAGKAVRSMRTIVLSPSGYRPRDEFTLAHEIAELHIPASWREHLPEATKERACNRVAAALLLPSGPFLYDLHETDWHLPAVRQRFPLVSYETVATRIVDLKPGASAASWVDGRRVWWRGPRPGANVIHLVKAERAALRLADRTGAARVDGEGVIARAWRLTARGKRVALTVSLVTAPSEQL